MIQTLTLGVDWEKAGLPGPKTEAELKIMLLPNTDDISEWAERPLILITPGGAYAYCSNREAEPIAAKFLAAGFHTAILRYSVAPDHFPTAALELAWSLQYIRSHAKEWHIRPDAIGTCGFSAGGHLACTVGTLWEDRLFEKTLGAGAGWRPDFQILGYPVISMGEFTHAFSRECLLGKPEEEGNQLFRQEELSLETRVGPHVPPTFLWHTLADESVPVENSLMYAAALRKAGAPFEMHIYERGEHGLATCEPITARGSAQVVPDNAGWIDHAIRFVHRRIEA